MLLSNSEGSLEVGGFVRIGIALHLTIIYDMFMLIATLLANDMM